MIMRRSNVVLFAKSEFLSHRIFPLTESFFQRAFFPLKVTEKLPSKDYIGEMKEMFPSMDDRSQSAVAPLLTDFIVILKPLTSILSKEKSVMTERKMKYD